MPDGVQRELGTITEQIKNLSRLFEDGTVQQNVVLEEIKKKLDYTNGKVRNHDFWIKAVKWGAGIVSGIAIAVIPYIAEYISNKISEDVQEKINLTLDAHIEKVLSTYEFDIK